MCSGPSKVLVLTKSLIYITVSNSCIFTTVYFAPPLFSLPLRKGNAAKKLNTPKSLIYSFTFKSGFTTSRCYFKTLVIQFCNYHLWRTNPNNNIHEGLMLYQVWNQCNLRFSFKHVNSYNLHNTYTLYTTDTQWLIDCFTSHPTQNRSFISETFFPANLLAKY